MAKLNDIKDSNYLTKEDCEPALTVTISHCVEEDVSMANQPAKMKYVVYFEGQEKGMVLNLTNFQRIVQVSGRDDTDNWKGVQINLYNDPTVDFGGKLVGGIRVWVQQTAPPGIGAASAKQQSSAEPGTTNPGYVGDDPPPPTEDDIPY
ncbi:hypothetical protein LCGC14_2482420 [marine sediment metagenome]|uniref:Uncharacterized protein n=2 Tax=marine sediment metagenome TaxID=412755 RepID=A0A0F9B768_9ZZZZ